MLVTLGIIGVVSAMTVPSLINNYQRQTYVTQLHKVYNELSQAFLQEMTDKNAVDLREAGLGIAENILPFLQSHFKVIESGAKDRNKTPWGKVTYRNINGTTWDGNTEWGCGACAVIASGSHICVDNVRCYSSNFGGYSTNHGYIFVDVNGQKGPNIFGRDAFFMTYFPDGVIDVIKATPACRTLGICDGDSMQAIRESAGAACDATATYTDQRCFGSLLNNNWQMTY